MAMRHFSPAMLLVAVACGDGSQDFDEGRAAQPIYGGVVDTVNDAVVLLVGGDGSVCTGTIIARTGTVGYVLTAAHCTGREYVVQADDYTCVNDDSCDGLWPVTDDIVDPAWTGDLEGGHDFRILRFDGATALTPVIPIAGTSDGAAAQVMTTVVGYGLTEIGETTSRRQVIMPIEEVETLFVYLDQSGGEGFCSGDSGAPFLVGGAIVATASFADENCNQFGVGVRISSARDWIQSVVGAGGTGGAGGSAGSGGAGGGSAGSGGAGGGSAGDGGASNEAGAGGETAGGSGGAPGGGQAGSDTAGTAGATEGGAGGTAASGGSSTSGGALTGGASGNTGLAGASGGPAATPAAGDDGGCGCRTTARHDRPASLAFLFAMAAASAVKRRRASRRASHPS